MTNELNTVEIYYGDLSDEKQEELLEAHGIESPDEANWDVFPVATASADPEVIN